MNATFGTWKVAVAGVLALLAQSAPQTRANEVHPVPVAVNRPVAVASKTVTAPVYGPAPAAPAAKSAAANGEQKTAFWGCWNPCYTQPVCRPVYPTYPTYPTYPGYPYGYNTGYGYGTPGYGYGVPGYGYGTGYGVGYGVGYGPSYGVPGYGAYGVGISGTVPTIAAPVTVPTYGSPVLGSPSVLPAVAPVTAPVVGPTINPVYPGVAPMAPVAPYSPFYGSKDSGKVNATVPVDVTRRARATSSPYFE